MTSVLFATHHFRNMSGFIKLQRDVQGTWIHKDPVLFKAWCDILFNVNWEEKEVFISGTFLICRAGESLNSLDTWASIFGKGWNKSKVRRFFTRLNSATLIDTITERKTTRLTVLNIEGSENSRHDNGTITDTKTKRKPTPTKEQRIKNKEIEESSLSENLKNMFSEYLEMRVKIGKKLKTSRAIKTKLSRLEKYMVEYGEQKTADCITATLDNEWQDIKMDWFENLNGKPKGKVSEQNPENLNLESYLLEHFREVDLKHMKKDGSLERWTKQLEENKFRLGNIAKTYKNKTFTTLLLFEISYLSLGRKLTGSTPQRKLDSFLRWYSKLTQYEQEQGNIRELLKASKT